MPEPAQVKEQVQQKVGELKEQVAGQATSRLEDQKSVASDGLSTVAQAFRQTGEQLRGQEQEGVAQYVDRAAERMEQFANYLGGRDLRGLARDAEQFARREPALFLGGAFAVGLLAARFLKSSGPTDAAGQETWRGQSDWYGQATSGGATRPMLPPPAPPVSYPISSPVASGVRGSTPASAAGSTRGIIPATPSAGMGGGNTRGAGMATSSDVIVGGPPIDDVLVGGPPIDRGRETR